MKKAVFSLLSLALVFSITGAASAQEPVKAASNSIGTDSIYYDYEPNDSVSTANPYEIGHQINGSLSDPKAMDYYKFTATQTQKVRFTIAYSKGPSGKQDFRLSLYGTGVSTTATTNTFDYTVTAGQTYYLRVIGMVLDLDGNQDYSVYTTVLP